MVSNGYRYRMCYCTFKEINRYRFVTILFWGQRGHKAVAVKVNYTPSSNIVKIYFTLIIPR